MTENGLLNEALDISRLQAGLQGQGREGGVEFGEAVGGDVALARALVDGLEAGKGDGVVRMLLEERGHQHGGVKTSFHRVTFHRVHGFSGRVGSR